MTISYDSYPFRPQQFAAAIAGYISGLEQEYEGLANLHSAAIALFDNDSNVRKLASEYGGWDRQTITAQRADADPAFWLILFLYAHFFATNRQIVIPLGSLATLSYITKIAGWSDEDCRLFTHGARSFKDFALQWLYKEESDHSGTYFDFWNHFQPECMYGHLGWLNTSDIQSLASKLSHVETHFSELDFGDHDRQHLETKFYRAKNILLNAIENDYCLCLVQSA